jgi:hypothetical protein
MYLARTPRFFFWKWENRPRAVLSYMTLPLRGKYEYLNLHRKVWIYACHACAIKGQTTMTSSVEAPYIIEFTVKSGQHGTNSLCLVKNRVRLKKHLQKKYISLERGVKLRNAPLFVPNWVWSGFDPVFPFCMTGSNCCYIYFHYSYVYNYYNTSNVVH